MRSASWADADEQLAAPHAYLECHIEQGPVLRAANRDIGVVTGVQAICWHELTIVGKSAHAGTTPMSLRADAGVAAARINVRLREMVASGRFGIRAARDDGRDHAPPGPRERRSRAGDRERRCAQPRRRRARARRSRARRVLRRRRRARSRSRSRTARPRAHPSFRSPRRCATVSPKRPPRAGSRTRRSSPAPATTRRRWRASAPRAWSSCRASTTASATTRASSRRPSSAQRRQRAARRAALARRTKEAA